MFVDLEALVAGRLYQQQTFMTGPRLRLKANSMTQTELRRMQVGMLVYTVSRLLKRQG